MGEKKAMYHQIFVPPKDRDALRFVSCKFLTDPIEDYRMSVHIFGKIDSPYIANWVLKQLKTKQRVILKEHLKLILEHFYMDDVLYLFSSQTKVIIICNKISKILKNGGFHLIKIFILSINKIYPTYQQIANLLT